MTKGREADLVRRYRAVDNVLGRVIELVAIAR